jgi:hypothetical protein
MGHPRDGALGKSPPSREGRASGAAGKVAEKILKRRGCGGSAEDAERGRVFFDLLRGEFCGAPDDRGNRTIGAVVESHPKIAKSAILGWGTHATGR